MRWFLLVVLTGCSLYRSDDTPTWPGDDLPACDTTRQAYRIDAIDIPMDSTESDAFGWDLDGDGTTDNQGGNIIGDQTFDIVARGFQAKVVERENELGPCTPQQCDSVLRTLYGVFDDNLDGIITLSEIKASSLFQTLLRPDLDLDGDGTPEHLSIGVGFHAAAVDLFERS